MRYGQRSKRERASFFKALVMILILFSITFIVIPSIRNYFDNIESVKFKKEIQTESEIILSTAHRALGIKDLPSLGVMRTVALTPDVFNNLNVIDVVKYLSTKRLLNSDEASIITRNNPDIKLGNLKVIVDSKTKNISVDSDGYLSKLPNA